jgi:alkanesulfonate monooxygenase SsuD/methylene tetrahydromethanopterin reductase-like flavin-dependent oxidoreductase (luciferase family)
VLLGLHPTRFVSACPIRDVVTTFARRVDEIGVHGVWPMDQLRQIPVFGPADEPVLEPYTLLSWLAARTERVQLGVLATAGAYRHPVMLAKTVSTLDVLSGGRTWLGIGASWGGDADVAAGIDVPPSTERYARVEEMLTICDAMFRGSRAPIEGPFHSVLEPLNSPLPLRHPPVLIAGSGARRTLPLVAERADACNFLERIGVDEIAAKVGVLRDLAAAVGRAGEDIAVTTFGRLGTRDLVHAADRFGALAEAGVDLAMVDVPDLDDGAAYDYLAELVALLAPLGRPTPPVLTVAGGDHP